MSPERYSEDVEVVSTACRWLEREQPVYLVSVIATWGASPRPPGSLLAMRGDGCFCGSVSGGCIEDDLIERLQSGNFPKQRPAVLEYGVDAEQLARFALPCGGRLRLLIETLSDGLMLHRLLDQISHGELVERRVSLVDGAVELVAATPGSGFVLEADCVRQVFGPQWLLLLIGAGELAGRLAQMAQTLGFRVVVCDPRERHRAGWSVQGAELTAEMPDEAVKRLADHPRAAVVTLAHDPRVDDMALMEALCSGAFYVGALGSARTSSARRKRLGTLGLDQSQLGRLRAPVGLDIGSRTPAEIAISVMAQIIAVRHQRA